MVVARRFSGCVGAGVVLGLACAAPPVWALDAAAIELGAIDLYPSLGLSERYIDNFFWTESNEQDTWVSMLMPRMDAVLDGGNQRYTLTYRGEIGRVHSFQRSNYSDHQMLGLAELDFTSRLRAEILGEYLQDHDDVGTERTEALAAAADVEPDQWHAERGGGKLRYGAPSASGQLELSGAYTAKTYDNNRAVTRFRDRDDLATSGTFYWRVMPKTRALVEVRHVDIEYDRDAPGVPTLDSRILSYFVGATWEATGRTTGAVRLGQTDRNYDSGARSDSKDFAWEVGMTWEPRTYSMFEFTTARTPFETNNGLTDDGYLRDEYSVLWTHEWRPRVKSLTLLRYAEDEYESFGRHDENLAASAELRYAARRWLDLGVGYAYDDRDSNFGVFEHERHMLLFTVTGSL